MAEYIDKGTAIAKLTALEVAEPNATMTSAKRMLADIPAADVAPVVHGRWAYHNDINFWQCSVCGVNAPMLGNLMQLKTNYCPNCGAKMDEGNS